MTPTTMCCKNAKELCIIIIILFVKARQWRGGEGGLFFLFLIHNKNYNYNIMYNNTLYMYYYT